MLTPKPRYTAIASLLAAILAQSAHGETANGKQHFDIPAQSLNQALLAFGRQSQQQMMYSSSMTENYRSHALKGDYTPTEAINILLSDSALQAAPSSSGSITIKPKPENIQNKATPVDSLPVVTVRDSVRYDNDDSGNGDYIPPNTAASSTRTDTPIFDTPASIQVIAKPIIQDQQSTRLEDALQNVSGAFKAFSFYGGDNPDSAYILRGFATRDKYVNGVRMPDNAYDLSRVDRVEVLKGASGMLFGQMDPGGVINLVTKKPKEMPAYSVQQQFGSYDYFRTTASATGALSASNKLYYSLDFTYQDAGSFRNNVSDKRYIVTPMLSWRPTEKTEANLTYQHRELQPIYDSGIPAVNGAIANVPISTTYQQPGFKDKYSGDMIDFNWSHKFAPDWKITNGVVANWNTYNFNEIPIAYFQPLLDSNNLVRRGAWIQNGKRDSQTVYLNLNGKFNTGILKHNVLLGGDYFATALNQSGYFVLGVPFPERLSVFTNVDVNNPVFPAMSPAHFADLARNSPNDFTKNSQSWFGLYFQDQITLWDKLHLLGGGRYDWARAETNSVTGASFLNPANNSTANSTHFSPRVGLVYEPVQWLSVFGNYVESFHLQDASQRSASGTPLKPETSSQYEVGFKTKLLDDRLLTNVAFYNIAKQNVAATVGDNVFATVGGAKSQGAEIDINGQITDALSLNASYAYTDTKFTKDSGGLQGNRLPNVPRNSGSLWLKYAFQQPELQGFSIGGGVYPTGSRWADTGNTLRLSGYVREDIFAAYKINVGKTVITTQLNVKNLLDKNYFTNSSFGGSIYHNMPGEPRTFMGSIRIEF